MKQPGNNFARYLLIVLAITYINYQTAAAQQLKWIPFYWETEVIEGRSIPDFSITIPVKIESLQDPFKMQLDLGSAQTFIYGNSFAPYLNQDKEILNALDSSGGFYAEGKRYPVFRDFKLKLGQVDVPPLNVGYYEGYGQRYETGKPAMENKKLIGTIGCDIFLNKVLILDYPHQRIAISDHIPAQFAGISLEPVSIEGGRIVVSLNIDSRKQRLLFDTGSSMFSLLTTQHNVIGISEDAVIDSLKTTSWGDVYYVYQKKLNSPIRLGNHELKSGDVFYDKIEKFDRFYDNQNIWGIIGNKCFRNNILIIDFSNSKIGML